MDCEKCKINSHACYDICKDKDLESKCKELFGMSCLFDVMDNELRKRIKEELDNMITLDEFENN